MNAATINEKVNTQFTYSKYVTAAPGATAGTPRANEMTAEDLGAAAGITGWKINRSRVRYGEGDSQRIVEDKHVLFRSDNKDPLGVVSDQYKIVQPADVWGFMTGLCDKMGFELSTAGTIDGGKRFFASARLPNEEISVGANGSDKHVGFILLSTSCDGSMATRAQFEATRLRCGNQLAMLAGKQAAWSLNHRTAFDAEVLRKALAEQHEAFLTYGERIKRLIDHRLTSDEAAMVLTTVVKPEIVGMSNDKDQIEAIDKVRESKSWQTMMGLFAGAGRGALEAESQGTAYGVLQAVTEFYDHHCQARSDENRFKSAAYGQNAKRKTDAFNQLLKIAEIA